MPTPLPDGAGVGRARRRALRLPVGRQGVARVARGGGGARRPGRRRGAARRVVPRRARPDRGAGRPVGRRQVDHRLARAPPLRRRRGAGARSAASTCATCPSTTCGARSAWSPRTATCSTTPSAPTSPTPPRTPTRTSIWAALASARLDALVRSLPDGLDTVVGERGYRLSGGERQRLTIARLLLAQPRVVILDEATAHLDSESEVAVQEALAAALAGRTAIVIAHRLSTIKAADAILVVEDGRVVEHGSHLKLLGIGRSLRRPVPHPVRGRSRRRHRLIRSGRCLRRERRDGTPRTPGGNPNGREHRSGQGPREAGGWRPHRQRRPQERGQGR